MVILVTCCLDSYLDNKCYVGGGQVAYGDLGETDGAFGGHFDDSDEEDYDDDDDSEEESEDEEKK